jgi:hypothetical protein
MKVLICVFVPLLVSAGITAVVLGLVGLALMVLQ